MGRKINFNPPVWLVVLFDSLKAPIVWINVVGQGVNALADLNINPGYCSALEYCVSLFPDS